MSSEADRRDEARARLVDDAAKSALKVISEGAVTYTPAERSFLQLAVAERLLRGVRLEAMSMMMREETETALREIEHD